MALDPTTQKLDLFAQLRTEAAALALDWQRLQRVRRLMGACQIHSMPANGVRLEWQPSGLIMTGGRDQGVLLLMDHHATGAEAPRVCRSCGCSDINACVTPSGACCWSALYLDGTGICSACVAAGPQLSLIPHSPAKAGQEF